MRKIDLDLIRPQIGEFTLTVNDKPRLFKVMKPTLKQKLQHEAELDETVKELKRYDAVMQKSQDEEKVAAALKQYNAVFNKWLHRQIEIFIPDFTMDCFEVLVDDQREAILALILERDIATDDAPTEVEKKTRRGRASRGEK